MGIHLNLAVLLREIAAGHCITGRVVTLGEQWLSFEVEGEAQPAGASSPAARFFARLGFDATESVDIDGFEGATHLFDLNQPDTPAVLSGKFNLVFNGGTLEHVFHVPNALANISRMLCDDGVVVHVLPCNNWVDHGFYQFSPRLMFDYYRAAGFHCLESMLLGYAPEAPDRWLVRCASPGLLGAGLAGGLDDGVYLHLFAARRSATVTLYPVPLQTGDEQGDAARVDGASARWFSPFALCDGTRRELPPRARQALPAACLAREAGQAWTAPLPEFTALADTVQRPARSPLVLLEDGRPLGPPHAAHAQIRSLGCGRYSHWDTTLYFATSDNSSPDSNGRRYDVVMPGGAALSDLKGLAP